MPNEMQPRDLVTLLRPTPTEELCMGILGFRKNEGGMKCHGDEIVSNDMLVKIFYGLVVFSFNLVTFLLTILFMFVF